MRTVVISIVCLVAAPAYCGDGDLSIARYELLIEGTAQGGSVTIGYSAHSDQTVSVDTTAGETAEEVATKLLTAFQEKNGVKSVELGVNGKTLSFFNSVFGNIFLHSTDAGIKSAQNVSNVTAVTDRVTKKVTLTWTLPAPAPSKIVIFRNGLRAAQPDGDATSFEDTDFGDDTFALPEGETVCYVIICCNGERLQFPSDR